MRPFRPSRRSPLVKLHRSRFALAAAIALGYAAEVLFQPDVFTAYTAGAIATAVGSIFLEVMCVGIAVVAAVAYVDHRGTAKAWAYASQLVLAVFPAACAGIVVWALGTGQAITQETLPYLFGEALRLTSLGVFLAFVHGFGQRIRVARIEVERLALEDAALQAETQLARLRVLEAQIEPHFLFNTIANVRRTWRVDAELGARMHDNAVRYLEASLPRMRAPLSSLGDEIELTRAYLELFALRMGPRLRFSIDMPPALSALAFPRMALLTLAENAIKHGVMPSADGGSIAVTARIDGNAAVVTVSDDGVGYGAADTSGTGIGLVNIRARLMAQYGRRARLEICAGEKGGVIASVRIPHDLAPSADTASAFTAMPLQAKSA